MSVAISCAAEDWSIAGTFVISRERRTVARVVVATVSHGGVTGRGECVPYRRYGETVNDVLAAIRSVRLDAPDRAALAELLPPGAARNALDCALWDLEAKAKGTTVAALCGIDSPVPVTTAYTLSLASPEEMGHAAQAAKRPILKVKLGGPADPACIAAVRAAAPDATLIVDPNEDWNETNLAANFAACAAARVALVEQPVAAGKDAILRSIDRKMPVCADESAHVAADLAGIVGTYDAVNIKLDKTGGLTEALAMVREARRLGIGVMVGCMVATSLAMAPAVLLAQHADYVDLDGPLLLTRDRVPGLRYTGSMLQPPSPELWG